MRMPAAARKRRVCIDLASWTKRTFRGNRGALTYLRESCDGITCLSLVKRLSTKICSKFLIGPTMNDYCRFARRRRHAGDIAIANERPNHLDAKIHPHDGRIFMMVEK